MVVGEESAGIQTLELVCPKSCKNPAFAEFIRVEGVDLLLNVHSPHIIQPPAACPPANKTPLAGNLSEARRIRDFIRACD